MSAKPSTSAKLNDQVTLSEIQNARKIVEGTVRKTLMESSRSCSERAGSEVFLKYENLQVTGSFKIRGAFHKISSLTAEEKARGIVASSAGNHAQGVAYAASKLGVKSHIVMPVTAPLVKVMATKGYGAQVILKGEYYDQAYQYARELEAQKGYVFVHPYQDPHVIAGQGTVGLEIFEEIADFSSIVVPVGGGGLISGIATVAKALNPKCKIYGVQPQAVPSLVESYRNKVLTKVESPASTIADGLAVKTPSQWILDNYLLRLIDDMVTVSEDEIADAIVFLMERAKTIVEGSGATSVAAALSGRLDLGPKTCIVLSGGNIDLNIVNKVIERGLKKHGRLAKLTMAVEDKPGTLSRITNVLALKKANIIDVRHDRGWEDLFLGETAIAITIETFSWEHLEEIKGAITSSGCRLL